MNDRREQYLWISFGNKSNSNQNSTIGVGYTVKDEKILTNYFCHIENLDYPWITKRYNFIPTDKHHLRLSVANGRYTLERNGKFQFEGLLPQSYDGGFLSLGSAYSGTEISNVEISGKPALPTGCRYYPDVCKENYYQMPFSDFYNSDDKKYTRVFNGSGKFVSNVPMVLFDGIYNEFVLEFDLLFNEGFMFNPPKGSEVKDPFDTYVFGPPPLGLFVDKINFGNIVSTKLYNNYFEIVFDSTHSFKQRKIFLSCPNIGGVRISSEPPKTSSEAPVEKTAIFEPSYNCPINKENFNNELVGKDGTKVKFIQDGDLWRFEIFSFDGKLLYKINKWNLFYTSDRLLTRQYCLELPLNDDEVICGTGEHYSNVNQHGKKIRFWNTDPCYHGKSSHKTHDLWRSYKNVPLIISDRGITFFFNTTCAGMADFGYTDKTKMELVFDDYRMDFYIWAGSPIENLVKYTDLTGKPVLPPKWAYHYMAGGSNGFWGLGKGKEYSKNLLKKMIAGYKELGTPPSAIYCETGCADNKECHDICLVEGIKMLKWNCGDFSPAVVKKAFPNKDYRDSATVKSIMNPEEVHYIADFTHPDAPEIMKSINSEMISWGLRGGMVDFAELLPYDTKFYNGLMGNRMHNFWSWFYAKAYHDLYTELVGDDFLCYVRGGCAGSQKWNCTWTGDQHATFDGMKQQLTCGLTISASGFSIWGTDMSGLVGKPTAEMLIRAFQFNTFVPLMRTGGEFTKQPWDYGEKAVEVFKNHYWLRENIVETVYSYAVRSHKTGIPMAQAMPIAFPDFKAAVNADTQYLFCDNILVSAVLEENSTEKQIYFPRGRWYSLFTDDVVEGETVRTIETPIEYSPAYLRDSAVLPITLDEKLKLFAPMSNNRINALLIAPPETNREHFAYIDENTKITFKNTKTSDKSFEINVDGNGDYNAAIILAEAENIKINETELQQYDNVSQISEKGGFISENGKTYIYTPKGSIEVVSVQI